MKKILLAVLLFISLSSCDYDTMHLQYEYASVSSKSLFVVNGNAYTFYDGNLPISVYNPNSYEIVVVSSNKEFTIPSLEVVTFESTRL